MTDTNDVRNADRSTAQLVKDLSEQTTHLMRSEAKLGQTAAELAAKADVKQRASEATQQVKQRASDATERGVEPIRRNPGVSVAGALALIVLLIVIRRIRNRR